MVNANKAIMLSFLMISMTLAGCTHSTSGPLTNDSDGDGVVDASDLCPNTPQNTFVDSTGCEAPCPDFKVWDDFRNEHELFGNSVESDGISVIVGAQGSDYSASSYEGKAFVFICGADGWELEGELIPNIALLDGDSFGFSVAIYGDYAIVGAPNKDVIYPNGTTYLDAGAAYIFKRNSMGVWDEHLLMNEPTPNDDAHYGWSVDLGNEAIEPRPDYDAPVGDFNAAVGAPGSNAVTGYKSGAAYFHTTDSNGVEFAHAIRLEANTHWHDGSMCNGCGWMSGPWDLGGYGVDVAIYRTTAVVGSPIEQVFLYNGIPNPAGIWMQNEVGAIYIFERIVATPGVHSITETTRINVPDTEHCYGPDNIVPVTMPNGVTYTWSTCNNADFFGRSVDIHQDTIIVGAGGPMTWTCWGTIRDSEGAAYIFEKNGAATWDENTYVRLTASVNTQHNFDPPKQDFTFNTNAFGWEVSIYRDIVLVGSPVRTGHNWVYAPWALLHNIDIGVSDGDSFLFSRSAPLTWNEVAIVKIPDISRAPNYLGHWNQVQGTIHNELAIGGNYIILGSSLDDVRPISWTPWSGFSTTVVGGWPAHQPDFSQGGQNTGSAYICYYNENSQIFCDWDDVEYPNGSFTWGSYSIANDTRENNSDDMMPQSKCPYSDISMCRVMGYLYSEETALLYGDEPYDPVCTDRWVPKNDSYIFNEHDFTNWGCYGFDNTDNGSDNGTDDGSNDDPEVVYGCTDSSATNYDADATRDDGSCTYKEADESEEE